MFNKEKGVTANGNHGFGTGKQNLLTDIWKDLFKNWLAAEGFLPSKK
jgi:hypothetical protein